MVFPQKWSNENRMHIFNLLYHIDTRPHFRCRIIHFGSLLPKRHHHCTVAPLQLHYLLLLLHFPIERVSRIKIWLLMRTPNTLAFCKSSSFLSVCWPMWHNGWANDSFVQRKLNNYQMKWHTGKLSSSSSLSILSSLASLTSSSEVSAVPSTCFAIVGPLLANTALICCWSTDVANAGGKFIIDWMIGVSVKALWSLFSCKADAGTWISKTRGSEFGELGNAGNLQS